MSLLERIDRLSFTKVISIAFILAIILAIPTTVILIRQRARFVPEAFYQKPELVESKPEPVESKEVLPLGRIQSDPPKIDRVFPWVGKAGDIIWIQGENFGNNPRVKKLTIAGVILEDDDITSWLDKQIQAIIPQGARQGGVVEVKIGQHPLSSSLPIVLYSNDTKIKLTKKGNIISALNGQSIDKVKVWMGDENIPLEVLEVVDISLSLAEAPLFDTEGKPILTILLYDKKGQILPYYVNPVEFGF